MNGIERGAVRTVAKLSPWLAPLPSAYFVARSAMAHLDTPLTVAVIMAAIIETLGLATVHTALWLYEWNAAKRKTDPASPLWLAIALGAVYIVATWGLVVALEVWPALATFAPAIFPALAVVGSLNLAIVARQESKEAAIADEKAARRAARVEKKAARAKSAGNQAATVAQVGQPSRMSRAVFLAEFPNILEMSDSQVAEAAGVSERTSRNWKQIARANNGHGGGE